MPSGERAGGKGEKARQWKLDSRFRGRRTYSRVVGVDHSQVRDRISLIGRKRRASIHCDSLPWCGEISAIKQRPYSVDQRAT